MKNEDAIREMEDQFDRIKRDWPGVELTKLIVHAADDDLDDLVAFMKKEGVPNIAKREIKYFAAGGETEWVAVIGSVAKSVALIAGALAAYCHTRRCKVQVKKSGDVSIDAPSTDEAIRVLRCTDEIVLKRKKKGPTRR